MKLRRLYFVAIAVACLLLVTGGANSYWQSRDQSTGGGFVAGCTESSNFITRAVAADASYDAAHKTAVDALICGLVTDGIFSKYDVLYVFATQSAAVANLNLVSSSFTGTPTNSPVFTTDRGYTGSALVKYIDSGFNASTASSPKYVLNSAHIAFWSVTDVGTSSTPPIGIDSSASEADLFQRYSDGNSYFRMNSTAAGGASVANATAKGYYIANRSSSTAVQGYKNGSSVATNNSSTSSNVLNYPFPILAIRHLDISSTEGNVSQLAMASIGSSLSSTNASDSQTRFQTYMTAVGVP